MSGIALFAFGTFCFYLGVIVKLWVDKEKE